MPAGERPANHALSASAFAEYFRCLAVGPQLDVSGDLSPDAGYFRFQDAIGYGRCARTRPSELVSGALPDVSRFVTHSDGRVLLPFDLDEVVINLRRERYHRTVHTRLERLTSTRALREAYYLVRPLLPVGLRKHLQTLRLRGWETIRFPAWPVDVTVDRLMRHAMAHVLSTRGIERIPFIWFWPDGLESCVLMTHDVEGKAGREFCPRLMDLDESFGIRSSFQVVPESASSDASLGQQLRARGFEVNVHDLTHDGSLFADRARFERRAAAINRYARALGARGFRSGAMYREQDWYEALDIAYDMSVPNVAHLEAQRGGCCTVMPYFVGDVLELPLTTTQDYSLFHILHEYSTALWERQMAIVRAHNGLISFIAHPDYLVDERARATYVELLAILARLRSDGSVWIAQPAEVDGWWRERRQMSIVESCGSLSIEGPGSERARVAHAALEDGRLVFTIERSRAELAGLGQGT